MVGKVLPSELAAWALAFRPDGSLLAIGRDKGVLEAGSGAMELQVISGVGMSFILMSLSLSMTFTNCIRGFTRTLSYTFVDFIVTIQDD